MFFTKKNNYSLLRHFENYAGTYKSEQNANLSITSATGLVFLCPPDHYAIAHAKSLFDCLPFPVKVFVSIWGRGIRSERKHKY